MRNLAIHRADLPSIGLIPVLNLCLVLLFFCLAILPGEGQQQGLQSDIVLPLSSTAAEGEAHALALSISPSHLFAGDRAICSLNKGLIPPTELEAGQIRSLREYLSGKPGNSEKPSGDVILLSADKGIPYGTIRRIMITAGASGYPKFRLKVQRR